MAATSEDKENERDLNASRSNVRTDQLPARRESLRSRTVVNYADDLNDPLLKRALALSVADLKCPSFSGSENSDDNYTGSNSDHDDATNPLSEADDGEGEAEGEGEASAEDEDSENSEDTGEKDDEDCERLEESRVRTRSSGPTASSTVKQKHDSAGKFRHKTEEQAEKYFSSQRSAARRRSGGRSLSKMDKETISDMLATSHNPYRDSIDSLHQMYRDLYQYWLFQISQGFNILLYGVGSKRAVLEGFCTTHLTGAWHVVIDGCYPNLVFKSILSNILTEVLDCSNRISLPILQCQHICEVLCDQDDECPCSELFLVVHNIDGQSLRDAASQRALSLLAHCPHVHITATCDHAHTPLLWDELLLARFRWAWHDATTFERFWEEVKYEDVQVVSGERSRTLTLSSVTTIVSSLTPNARGIFDVLARHQLDHQEEDSYKGLDFMDLYRMCRSKFLVNSDIALKTQLTEFQDHKLIRYVKDAHGTVVVVVSVETDILREFVEKE